MRLKLKFKEVGSLIKNAKKTDSAEKTSYPDFFSDNVIPRFKFSSSSTTSILGIAYAPLFINYIYLISE